MAGARVKWFEALFTLEGLRALVFFEWRQPLGLLIKAADDPPRHRLIDLGNRRLEGGTHVEHARGVDNGSADRAPMSIVLSYRVQFALDHEGDFAFLWIKRNRGRVDAVVLDPLAHIGGLKRIT